MENSGRSKETKGNSGKVHTTVNSESRRPPRKTVIRHVPFKWALEEEEADHYDDEIFLNSGPSLAPDDPTPACDGDHKVACEAIQKIASKIELESQNLVYLKYLAHQVLRSLREASLAHGREAAEILVACADYIISRLDDLGHVSTEEFLLPIARNRNDWPCRVSLNDLKTYVGKTPAGQPPSLRERLEAIRLGSEAGIRSISDVVPNRFVHFMVETIRANQRELRKMRAAEGIKEVEPVRFERCYEIRPFPDWAKRCGSLRPLCEKGAWKDWFEVGWAALLEATGRKPEQVRELRTLGLYRLRKYQKNGVKMPTGTAECEVRHGIKQKLKESFQRLSNLPN